jgi:molybdopterin synthase catalytic subunit
LIVKVQEKDFIAEKEIQELKNNCMEIPGAINSFIGYVRNFSNEKKLTSLTIEHYSGMTEKMLLEISTKASQKWPLLGTLIIHRYGKLNIGDQIVLAASASLHRNAAFEATQFIMDYLKTKAPFWKSEEINNQNKWVLSRREDEQALKKWED